ncbi:tyrosine-type recombinase/integrase [Alphaproteobacteria bacterium LSUCC0684]
MTICSLTPSLVARAHPRSTSYIIRDAKLKGFHLRVMAKSPARPARRSFALEVMRGGVTFRETIGDADRMSLKDARAIARRRIAALTLAQTSPSADEDVRFDTLAEMVFSRRARLWKPSTLRVNRDYLKNQLLPFFGDMPVAAISRNDVETWFAGLSDIPEGANRSVPVLSAILREAEEMGLRAEDSNPTIGLRRYRRQTRERVLTTGEMARLGQALARRQERFPRKVAIITLIILTGCRKNEIMKLRWRDYRGGHFYLADSKTGPKMVFLSAPARLVLEGVKTKRSGYVFPARGGGPLSCINSFWKNLRAEAGLDDLRLHDLRHNYASIAIRKGESLGTIGRLLGHHQPASTLRYAHLDDAMMHQAVERITTSMLATEAAE